MKLSPLLLAFFLFCTISGAERRLQDDVGLRGSNDSEEEDETVFELNSTEVYDVLAENSTEVDEVLAMAKRSIEDLIKSRPNLSPKYVRLGFHDCVGGCDGCVDLSNPDNFGLKVPINSLESTVKEFERRDLGISRADIWALAALTGAEATQRGRNAIPFRLRSIGRKNCVGGRRRGPKRDLPGPDLTTTQLLRFFHENFQFSVRETVAIMGAHTLGAAQRQNSGFDGSGGWVPRRRTLNNEYYELIVGGNRPTSNIETLMDAPNWNQVRINNRDIPNMPSRSQWNRRNLFMLNADVSLVRDFSGRINNRTGVVTCEFRDRNRNRCPYAQQTLEIAAEYKFDNDLWLEQFRDAFTKMTEMGLDVDEQLA